MTRSLLAAAFAALVLAAPASAAVYQPIIEASVPVVNGGIVVHVGDSVTFKNVVPCPSACSQSMVWFNGINRLGYFMGYLNPQTYTFNTARSGPVQVDVGIPTYPGSRLVKHYTASVYITVQPAVAAP